MKSDLYTKFVLTAIALSLSVIAIQLTTKEAHAQSQGLKYSPSGALMVTICDPTSHRKEKGGHAYWTNCVDVENKRVAI